MKASLLLLGIMMCIPFLSTAQWEKSVTLQTHGVYEIDFPALDAAYAVGDLGTLYKSTNAGVTWTEHYNFGPFSSLSDVRFFNADTGIVSVGMGQMITFDGGVHWNNLGSFPKVKISGNMLYTSYVSNDTAYIQESHDYGATWSVLYQHYEADAQPFQLSFLNVDSAFFINPKELEEAYRTTDGFMTVDTIQIFTGEMILQEEFDFKDMIYGFMYGSWGSSSHPTRAWNVPVDLDGFGVLPLLDLCFTRSKIYASSLYGKVFVSQDNGSTWVEQLVPDNTPVYSVSFLNDSVGIAVGKGFYYTAGSATSIDNPLVKPRFKVYPNPTSGKLNLEYERSVQIERIQLMDRSGRVYKTFPKQESILNLEGVASGVYFLNIQTKREGITQKIIVH